MSEHHYALPVDVTDDVFLLIFSHLAIHDLVALRLTCKRFSELTKHRHLWIRAIDGLTSEDIPLPLYLKDLDGCQTRSIELFALRIASLNSLWKKPTVCWPQQIVRLEVSRSIGWTKIAAGRWLLACSDIANQYVMTCWDIAQVMRGNSQPLMEHHFQSYAYCAKVYVDLTENRIRIAVNVNTSMPVIQILSFSQVNVHDGFLLEATIPAAGRVCFIAGDYVGHAHADNLSEARIFDYRRGTTQQFADIPGVQGRCLAMALLRQHVVVAQFEKVEIFSMSNTERPFARIQSLPFDNAAEIVVIRETLTVDDHAWDALDARKRLRSLDLNATILSIYTVSQRIVRRYELIWQDDTQSFSLLPRAMRDSQMPPGFLPPPLHVGVCGKRALWTRLPDNWLNPDPQPGRLLPWAWEPLQDELQDINNSGTDIVSRIWAHTAVDFDDALGLAAIGSVSPELVICNYLPTFETAIYDLAGESHLCSEACVLPCKISGDPVELDPEQLPHHGCPWCNNDDEHTHSDAGSDSVQ